VALLRRVCRTSTRRRRRCCGRTTPTSKDAAPCARVGSRPWRSCPLPGPGIGVARLFGLRYSRGDAIRDYSTLRADPLRRRVVSGFAANRRPDGAQKKETEGRWLIYGRAGDDPLAPRHRIPAMLDEGAVEDALGSRGSPATVSRAGLPSSRHRPALRPEECWRLEDGQEEKRNAKDGPGRSLRTSRPPEAPGACRWIGDWVQLSVHPLIKERTGASPDVASTQGDSCSRDRPAGDAAWLRRFLRDSRPGWRVLTQGTGAHPVISAGPRQGNLVFGRFLRLEQRSAHREPNAGSFHGWSRKPHDRRSTETPGVSRRRPAWRRGCARYALHGFVAAICFRRPCSSGASRPPFLPAGTKNRRHAGWSRLRRDAAAAWSDSSGAASPGPRSCAVFRESGPGRSKNAGRSWSSALRGLGG